MQQPGKQATNGASRTAAPKYRYVRSKKLLLACREIACQHCGARDGTVVAAHSNQSKHGKGRGIKASDIYVAALCGRCHNRLDQGSGMDRAERVAMWDAAHRKTVAALLFLDLWPTGVDAP